MHWKVLITAAGVGKAGRQALELLRAEGCEIVMPPEFGPHDAGALTKLLPGVDAVLASLDEFSNRVLASSAASQLKIIARWGVGYDSVHLEAATKLGIVVTNTPGLLDDAVADQTLALLLALARRVVQAHSAVAQGQWIVSWGNDLAGKTLGLVGCGRIGQAVARRAAGFNMRLLACDPSPAAGATQPGVSFVSLDELLAESDFVSLHAALTPQTRGLIGEAQLRRMKATAFLVNTARGALLDETALVRALREGWIAGAALDVFVTEPLPAEHPLRSAPNVLLTPHQASFTFETGERVSLTAAQAIVDLMQGRRPAHVLNPAVLDSGALRAGPH